MTSPGEKMIELMTAGTPFTDIKIDADVIIPEAIVGIAMALLNVGGVPGDSYLVIRERNWVPVVCATINDLAKQAAQ